MVFNVTINQSYVTLVNPEVFASKVSPLLGDLGLCAAKVLNPWLYSKVTDN